MKEIKRNIKQAINALSSAHAGEMLHRKGKHRQLHHSATTPAIPSVASKEVAPVAAPVIRRKQVALWLKDLPTRAVLDYALSSCQRMDMDLLILHAGKPRAQDLLSTFGEVLEGANVQTDIQALEGADEATLFRHIERTPRIAFLVMGNADALEQPLGQSRVIPPVPVVVLASAETKADQDNLAKAIAA